jgi:hypothetical protein
MATMAHIHRLIDSSSGTSSAQQVEWNFCAAQLTEDLETGASKKAHKLQL